MHLVAYGFTATKGVAMVWFGIKIELITVFKIVSNQIEPI
jgi:hypothetical protein